MAFLLIGLTDHSVRQADKLLQFRMGRCINPLLFSFYLLMKVLFQKYRFGQLIGKN